MTLSREGLDHADTAHRQGRRRVKVLVLSTTFPNPRQPNLGVFVEERMRRVARDCEVVVVAAVPWFPLNRLIRGTRWTGVPAVEERHGLAVHHPRFFCVPRYAKSLDGLLYAASLLPVLAKLRSSFRFDVIDAHFAYPDGLAAVLLGRMLKVPVMITLRGSIVRLSGYRLHRPQLRWALERATGIVAVSKSLMRVACNLGIPEQKIRVIPNGVDSEAFRPLDRAAARAACGLPENRTIILSVGGVYEGKGHHLVIDALRELVRRRPDLLYVVVGTDVHGDRYRQRLEEMVEAHALREHVRFVGGRPHDELPTWYGAADLFCLATRSEGWANVLLESLACGLPVVTTDVGGNAEIVRHGRDGLLVAFGDVPALGGAIEAALARQWDREAIVAHAQQYTWDRTAAAVVEELTALVRPGQRGRQVDVMTPSHVRSKS